MRGPSRHDVLRSLLRSDASIEAAAATLLAEAGEHALRADATWGVVSLTGTAQQRGCLHRLVGALNEVDGVVAVDSDDVARQ